MSDTILDDLQQPDDESPIYNLKIYNKITPLILISLGSLYVSIILFRYFTWRYRKRKAKKIRMDRQKLERFWRKQAAYIESQQAIRRPSQSYHHHTSSSGSCSNEKPKIPRSFDSTATLVVSSAQGPVHNTQQNQQSIIPEPQEETDEEEEAAIGTSVLPFHLRHPNTMIQKQQQQQKKGRKSKKDDLLGLITNRIDGNYQRKKRRQLLWQWSVAMGYCKYNHGHQLDLLVNRLVLESKNRDNNEHHEQ